MTKTILLIGGGGYIGNVIADDFLKRNYNVKIYDNFIYQNYQIQERYSNEQNIQIIDGDINDTIKLENNLKDVDNIVILAGLVGDPITKKYPKESIAINLHGIKNIFSILNKKNIDKVIFISTCSNYGLLNDEQIADEDFPLKPLSLYAEHKVQIENFILGLKGKVEYSPTILRFSTAFGLSPRMRFDLSINEFTYELANEKEILIYDEHTWRPYCHVKDFSNLVHDVIISSRKDTHFQIFNAGSNDNHATKKQIVDTINIFVPNIKVKYTKFGDDKRNYRVDFTKAREILDFKPSYSIKDGVKELINAIKANRFADVSSNRQSYGNYNIDYDKK